jgi:predicted Zn-dependent peptidase
MPGLETVAVGLHAESGSRHEIAAENGVAHMVEHMVFKGTATRSARGIAEAIEDAGGALNAYTARDTTVFHARLLAGDLALGVELIADLVRAPKFDADELEREKGVVLSELGEARDTPDDIVFDNLQTAAFPDQALGRSILGDEASIAGLDAGALRRWLDSQYRAGSLILCAAGKVDHAALVHLAEALFGDLPAGRRAEAGAAQFGGAIHLDSRRAEQAHLTLGFEGVSATDPDQLALRLFSEALGGGMSSRLFQELREERGLAYSIYSSESHYADTGLFTVYLATARRDAARALALVDRVMAGTVATLSPREVDRARAQAKAGLLMALESAQGQADFWARGLAVHGRLVTPAELVAELDALDVEQVRAAGRRVLSGPRAVAQIGAPKLKAA